MNRCFTCGHPLHVHGNDPHSMGCPPDRFRFTFQVGDAPIHETVASASLARGIARSLAASHAATIRIFKHGPRVPYGWEAN